MEYQDRRAAPRAQAQFRVHSRELPGQSATTLDFSPTGVQLLTQGPMEVEELIALAIESTPTELRVRGRVCWCRQRKDYFLVGIRFERLEVADRLRLEALCKLTIDDQLGSLGDFGR